MIESSKAQAIFDRVAVHLLTQKKKAFEPSKQTLSGKAGGSCRYRFGNLKCAIGCLIDDEAYDDTLEYQAVCDKDVHDALEASGLNWKVLQADIGEDPHFRFLSTLQNIHDDDNPMDWPEELNRFARKWNLSMAAVKKALNTIVVG